MRGLAALAVLLLCGVAAASAAGDGYDWHLPPGVSPPPVPAANPMSAAKVELGRRLFYDADLSRDGTTSCATCHEQHRAFTEGNATHPGVGPAPGRRNVMALANVGYFRPLTWADPQQQQLEDQVLVPLMGDHPVEMGMAGMDAELTRRLSEDSCYTQMFAAAFPESPRIDRGHITKALASFERTLISQDAPYDLAKKGGTALSPAAAQGEALFKGEGHCASCHAGDDFTDLKFHHIGLYNEDGKGGYPARDHGLIEVTARPADEGAIRTPSLRNVALTGPYMHDGSVKSLDDAIRRHLDESGANPRRDAALKGVRLSPGQTADLVAFLQSLSDQTFVTDPAFALPKSACGKPL
jgi:cytochrome c peroxidase